jgi:hypothetical protein
MRIEHCTDCVHRRVVEPHAEKPDPLSAELVDGLQRHHRPSVLLYTDRRGLSAPSVDVAPQHHLGLVPPDDRLPHLDLRDCLPHHLDALDVEIALLPFETAAPRRLDLDDLPLPVVVSFDRPVENEIDAMASHTRSVP